MTAIVQATTHWQDPAKVLEASKTIAAEAMPGLDVAQLDESELLQTRGW